MRAGSVPMLAVRAVSWPLVPLLVVAAMVVEEERSGSAIDGIDAGSVATGAPYFAAVATCWVVGVLLTGRAARQAAGWAFLGLGVALAWSIFVDLWADLALGRDEAYGPLLATLSDSSFVWWFLFLALGLQSTPTAASSGRWRAVLWATVGSAVVFQLAALFRSTDLEAPYEGIVSPWALDGLAPVMATVATVAILLLALALLASVWLLVLRFRRSRGPERQQLLWLAAGAAPIAPCVVASFAASYTGHDAAAGLVMGVAIVLLAVGAGLSVARYRLYDVERVVSESAAYAMASGAVIAVFWAAVLMITRSIPSLSSSAQWPTSVATLTAAAVARPAYQWARDAVDRRFNRRRHDAVRIVREGLSRPAAAVEALIQSALSDPTARLVFAVAGRGWVTADGHEVVPGEHLVEVPRATGDLAAIEFDPARTEASVVAAVAKETAAEIDNVGLRAELARQVEVVTESRARLARAHLEERQRIERDLHDGAQQRILAIALQLRSARVNGQDDRLRREVDQAIEDLGRTVQELRDLASGLQPAALAGGGLQAAVADLATRIPIGMAVDVADTRFPAEVESAAWFVVAEAVSNAVKHAGAQRITIEARREDGQLHVVVTDDGRGGANPSGRGLQGLTDRVGALRGELDVQELEPHGTRVEAVLPCVS